MDTPCLRHAACSRQKILNVIISSYYSMIGREKENEQKVTRPRPRHTPHTRAAAAADAADAADATAAAATADAAAAVYARLPPPCVPSSPSVSTLTPQLIHPR